jgi:hypothetical protein
MVLDNLGAHRGDRRVRSCWRHAAASSRFLPACVLLPDFSPIEEAFSKLKALL